jgi:hypothetical protein
MHSRADGGFDGLQVKATGPTAVLKNGTQQLVYFAGDFLLDGERGFFSWAICSACSTGRNLQIFRLTSTNSPANV